MACLIDKLVADIDIEISYFNITFLYMFLLFISLILNLFNEGGVSTQVYR